MPFGITRYIIAILFVLTSFCRLSAINDGNRYAKNSVLSSGTWIQLNVAENGIYKLTYDEIKKQGISNPSKVKIYGYGGWILDENFLNPYIDDLPEVSVYINKGSDGIFNSGDYLLFYGRGTIKWSYKSQRFEHENNPYTNYGSYFMTESETGPKEMEAQASVAGAEKTLTVFDDYALHEQELATISNTGRELFGESFAGQTSNRQFSFQVPGITSDPGTVKLSFAAAPKAKMPVTLSIDGQTIVTLNMDAVNSDYTKAGMKETWGAWTGEKQEQITATVSCTTTGVSIAYLNHIVLNMKRLLQFYNTAYTFFRNKESISGSVRYLIDKAHASCLVWDITENYNVRSIQTSLEGTQLSFSTRSDNTLHEYVMVDLNQTFPTPQLMGKIENQNLHNLPQTDMIILTKTLYLAQAKSLAERHRAESLSVEVIDDKSVFNEFSSGTPDATAYRRFMKMFYDRAVSDNDKPKYLLFFGDGIFDNRHLTSDAAKMNPQNFLLTYQVKESLTEGNSYGTDDYFGFLDDNQGTSLSSGKIDLGIGRLPVSSVSQADDALNKITKYMDNKQRGNWKSKIIFTADNTDSYNTGDFCTHAKQSNALAQYMDADYPEYILYKYYMDVYNSSKVNGKTVYPEAKKAFLNTLKEGCFLLNYTGHGSTTAWSSEDMINVTDIRQMTYENLPLWITATCDFGWFDGVKTSAGEEAFLNRKSGAIALYTTSRVVESGGNFEIHEKLIKYLFQKDNSGKHLRLGDVLKKSKIDLGTDGNKLNYVLLGDPALTLNYPELSVRLETVNGEAINPDEILSFRALDKITLRGIITDEDGNKINDFSGNLETSVFDSKQTTESVMQNTAGERFSYTSYPNQIYFGNTEIKNGEFELSFTVPLDISYTKNNGKMNFYASDSQNRDAYGSYARYILAGTNEDGFNNDGTGPDIVSMYLNSKNFKDGDDVNLTPYFIANIYDEDGINFSGTGLGHDITICIDNDPQWTYILNKFYSMTDNNEGTVGFSIPELPKGNHTLVFRVWDILNNPSVDSLHFNVVKGYKPEIFDLTALGNPAKTNTYFVFDYNLPETTLDMTIRVYNLTGQLVWSYSQKGSSGYLKGLQIEWNLTNGLGNRVHPGVYIYSASIRTKDSSETTKAKKIIVLKQ